jgi:perosamine synthetase
LERKEVIPVFKPCIGEPELSYVSDAVKTGWVSSAGSYLEKFERQFAAYHDVKHCIALSNGTAALEVALHSVGVKAGDEVIIPSFTIMSVAVAVIRVGATPVVVDVDKHTWNISADHVAPALSEKVSAIIVVHGFGKPAEMEDITKIARQNNLKIIEDVAESIGSKYKGDLCGTLGDVASFSFYANKLITTGEGGCIISNDEGIAGRARKYINLYFGVKERFSHEGLGFNFRMTNMQAALGCGQLTKIDHFISEKKRVGDTYKAQFKNATAVRFISLPSDHVYWMYTILLSDDVTIPATEMVQRLEQEGVGARSLFKGLHSQQPLQGKIRNVGTHQTTERLYHKGLYLPSSLDLTKDDIGKVFETLMSLV